MNVWTACLLMVGLGFAMPNNPITFDELASSGLQDQIASISQNPESSSLSSPASPHAILFVSLTMPKAVLRAYLRQANQLGIPVVIRGLLKNDYMTTAKRLFSIIYPKHKSPIAGGVEIDPLWFSKYHIHAVPALVVMGYRSHSSVVFGNIPLHSMLSIVARSTQYVSVQSRAQEYMSGEGDQ